MCEILQEMIAVESLSLLALLFIAHPPLIIWIASTMICAIHIYSLYMNKPTMAKHVAASYLALAALTATIAYHDELAVMLSYVILVSAAAAACCRKTAAAALLLPLPFILSRAYVYAYTVAAAIVALYIVREEAGKIEYV